MSFVKWVPYETIFLTTFNYWEPSLDIKKNCRDYIVYHTKDPKTKMNVVVIEGFRQHKDGYRRCELFFRTFPGKHSGECNTEKEAKPYFDTLRETVSSKFKVKGKDLEQKIIGAFDLK